jgi:MFS family permease
MSKLILHNVQLLSWFNFFLDLRFYSPIAIIYFSAVTGSFALGMSIFSVVMLSSAIFEVPTGVFSDLIGRKQTLVWGAVASLVSVLLYALAPTYLFLLAGAVIEGIARAFYSGNNESLLMDTLAETKDEEAYAENLGKTSAMFQWALAVSAIVGGLLAELSLPLVMWISVVPAIFGVLIALQIREPRIHKEATTNMFAHLKEAIRLFRKNDRLRTLSLADAISYAQGEAGYQFRAAFIQTLWPLWAIGLAKTLSNIGAAISFHFAGRIVRKHNALPVLLVGKLYSLGSNIVSTVIPTPVSPIILSSSSLFFGTGIVASSDLLQREYSAAQRATMTSLTSLLSSVAFAIVALGVGLAADGIGPARALLSLQTLAIVSFLLNWKVFKAERTGAAK